VDLRLLYQQHASVGHRLSLLLLLLLPVQR